MLTIRLYRKFNPANRRASVRSVHSIEYSIYDKSDITSARKKIQRNTIILAGCQGVELWQAALKAIAYSRLIYTIAPEPRQPKITHNPFQHTLTEKMDARSGAEMDLSSSQASLGSYEDVGNSWYCQGLRRSLPPIDEGNRSRRSYAANLVETSPRDSDEPVLAITEVTNTPTLPVVVRHGDRTATDWSRRSLNGPSGPLKGPIVRDDGVSPFIQYQQERMARLQISHGGQSDGFRDVSLRCQLPMTTCVKILGYVMSPRDFSILKPQQQRTAFAWSQKRETLKSELEWRRKDESSQLLMLLSGAECVDY